jgi:hypothetical protein
VAYAAGGSPAKMVETRSVRASEGEIMSSSQLPRAPRINNPWLHKDDKARDEMNGIVDRLLGLMAAKGARNMAGSASRNANTTCSARCWR